MCCPEVREILGVAVEPADLERVASAWGARARIHDYIVKMAIGSSAKCDEMSRICAQDTRAECALWRIASHCFVAMETRAGASPSEVRSTCFSSGL